MKISNAVNVLKKISSKIENEEFPILNVMQKIASVLIENPNDKTALNMLNYFENRVSKGDLFVSRETIKQLFNTFYSKNTFVKNALSVELNEIIKNNKNINQIIENNIENQKKFDKLAKESIDQNLVHSLEKLVSPKESSSIEKSIIEKSQKYCQQELNRVGLSAKISFAGGQDNLILCQASFSTHKGNTNFIIPVEINNNNPIIPNLFLCNSGITEITEKNIKYAINKHAGEDLNFLPKNLLSAFASTKTNLNEISDIEKIVIKHKLDKAKKIASGIVGLEVKENQKQFEFKVPINEENKKIGEKLNTPHGGAEFKFGPEKVSLGAKLINQELSKLGFKNNKIKVASFDDNKIYYQVLSSGLQGFKVPIKIMNGNLTIPSMIISENGEIYDLSKDNINSLQPSLRVLASFSNLNELNDSELKDIVYSSMCEKNTTKADEAIKILSSRSSPLLKSAFEIFMKGLSGSLEENQSKCSKPIKVANSMQVLCGHLRVPLNKVYQDEFGNCWHIARKHSVKPENTAISSHRIVL